MKLRLTRRFISATVVIAGLTIPSPAHSQSLPAVPDSLSADSTSHKGIIYVFHAVDTEERGLAGDKFTNSLDFRDYQRGGVIARMTGHNYRAGKLDSFGKPIKLSWFLTTHNGYCHSTQGDCAPILTQMQPYGDEMKKYGDIIGWHYHLVDWFDYNGDGIFFWDQLLTFNGSAYTDGTDIGITEKIVAIMILEHRYYPSIFRAGWLWENTDFSNWLDDVLPFDFTNAAPLYSERKTIDAVGNVYDWRYAPKDWTPYHPSRLDYQQPGNLKRTVFHCLLSFPQLFQAFEQAARGRNVLVGAYVHSYHDNIETFSLAGFLDEVGKRYPGIKYKYVNALEGARLMLGLSDTLAPVVTLARRGDTCVLTSDEPLFSFPYGAVKDTAGRYFRVRPVRETPDIAGHSYKWVFDLSHVAYAEFACGGTDPSGNTFVTQKIKRARK